MSDESMPTSQTATTLRRLADEARVGAACGCQCDAPDCVEYRERNAENAVTYDAAADTLDLGARIRATNIR